MGAGAEFLITPSIQPDTLSPEVALAQNTGLKPDRFDTTNALARLIMGHPLENIFGMQPTGQIDYREFSGVYTGTVTPDFDWEIKGVVNTVRRAACITLASQLEKESLHNVALLPSDDVEVTPEIVAILQDRARVAFDTMQDLMQGLRSMPSGVDSTVFDDAMEALRPYIDPIAGQDAVALARNELVDHLATQMLTRTLAPAYIELLVVERIAALGKRPTVGELKSLIYDSDNVMLRGAAHGIFDLSLFGSIATDRNIVEDTGQGDPHAGLAFKTDAFSLESRRAGGNIVRMTDTAAGELLHRRRTTVRPSTYDVTETGCPANPELIRAVVFRAVIA